MLVEHIKQHVILWYLGHMNGYVEKALGKKPDDYDVAGITGEVDKLYALASQHVMMDSKDAFARVAPVIQQIQQVLQQLKPKPPMDGGDQVILETSMAETQRRAENDKARLALDAEKVKLDALAKNRQQQIDIALNASDNLTEERIKSAELTHDAQRLQTEQLETALTAQESAQRALGGTNG
jgi:hypothetical protein